MKCRICGMPVTVDLSHDKDGLLTDLYKLCATHDVCLDSMEIRESALKRIRNGCALIVSVKRIKMADVVRDARKVDAKNMIISGVGLYVRWLNKIYPDAKYKGIEEWCAAISTRPEDYRGILDILAAEVRQRHHAGEVPVRQS